MPEFTAMEAQFSQLEDVLQSPVVMLQPGDYPSTLLEAQQVLNASRQCCIVIPTSTGNQKLENIKTLYRSLAMLRKLKKQLGKEYSLATASLIGIYPSLDYPACVYELHTNADQYVSGNVFPYAQRALVRVIKHLLEKLLGANPAIGGLGLILYRE